MAIDNKVCNDELDDFDDLQNEYKGLLKDYEKCCINVLIIEK